MARVLVVSLVLCTYPLDPGRLFFSRNEERTHHACRASLVIDPDPIGAVISEPVFAAVLVVSTGHIGGGGGGCFFFFEAFGRFSRGEAFADSLFC